MRLYIWTARSTKSNHRLAIEVQHTSPMPLGQHIRKLGAPLIGLFKNKGLSSSGKQSSVVRKNSHVVRTSHIDSEQSATFRQLPPSSLPAELWMMIIYELGRREWMALCKVCWLLYHIAQPCLYEDIVLHIRENLHRDPQPQFKRTIDQRPTLGAYVRNIAFDMDDRPVLNHKERHPLLFELHLFPNLESLYVLRIHFDLELCNILHSLPRLKSVTVAGCTLDESLAIGHPDQDNFPHSSISTVKVLYPKRNSLIHAWAALTPAKLETLAVQSTSRASDAGLILNRIRKLNKISCLTTLSLDTFSPAVVPFLIASPQLRHLLLDPWRDNPPSSLMFATLPADAIPFLEDYSGPAEVSSTFIRGRPVQAIKFIHPGSISEDRLVEILISLRYSTVPLTSLRLNLRNATLGSWLSHIPVTVRYLAVEYIDWLDFEKWLPALSHLTSLHTFSGRFKRILHQEGVMKLSDTCPSLREIDNGRYRWRIGGQHVWELFMVSIY